MRKTLICLVALMMALVILPGESLAVSLYLVPDSDTRRLTEEELWQWDEESLGYIFNEIFARHGYNFKKGGIYEQYFSDMDWYTPNADSDNQRACNPQLTSTEWYNEALIKDVRTAMKAAPDADKGTKSVWDAYDTAKAMLRGFELVTLPADQLLAVYAAPDASAWRGANGTAEVSTSGNVYAAGWENGWLLIEYETNDGAVRVGYVNGADIGGEVSMDTQLAFERTEKTLTASCQLTDEPGRGQTAITTLASGAKVTYLASYSDQSDWDYVETTLDNGQLVRGFIPAK